MAFAVVAVIAGVPHGTSCPLTEPRLARTSMPLAPLIEPLLAQRVGQLRRGLLEPVSQGSCLCHDGLQTCAWISSARVLTSSVVLVFWRSRAA